MDFDRSRSEMQGPGDLGVGLAPGQSDEYLLLPGRQSLAEDRPCTYTAITTVLACPGAGDWSWPSNHSVLAGAVASACILAVARSAWIATPLVLLIAGSRVAAGVHYLHDVRSGLALGGVVVVLVVVTLRPVVDRLVIDREARRLTSTP